MLGALLDRLFVEGEVPEGAAGSSGGGGEPIHGREFEFDAFGALGDSEIYEGADQILAVLGAGLEPADLEAVSVTSGQRPPGSGGPQCFRPSGGHQIARRCAPPRPSDGQARAYLTGVARPSTRT